MTYAPALSTVSSVSALVGKCGPALVNERQRGLKLHLFEVLCERLLGGCKPEDSCCQSFYTVLIYRRALPMVEKEGRLLYEQGADYGGGAAGSLNKKVVFAMWEGVLGSADTKVLLAGLPKSGSILARSSNPARMTTREVPYGEEGGRKKVRPSLSCVSF
jgi:hypothetical protein